MWSFCVFQPHHLVEKYMVVQHQSIVCVSVCVSLLPLLWSWSVHQSPERVSARHLVRCLLHTSFVCVCVSVCAGPSLCLFTLPPRHCVYGSICCLLLFLSLSLISVLLGWSPRLYMSYFWRFLLWKDYPPSPFSLSLSLSHPLSLTPPDFFSCLSCFPSLFFCPRPSSLRSTVALSVLPLCNVLCIKSSLSLTPAVDRSEGWETRCNAIFSFVFTGGIFYHEDEFLRGECGQGKYHHSVLF